MQENHIKYIGIDPGKSGGIAVIYQNDIKALKCPDTVEEMAILFSLILEDTPAENVKVLIEKVWSRPTDGRASVFTFGTNYGQWQGIIATHEITPDYVTPSKWMKYFECPPKLKKKDRKHWLRDLARVLYVDLPKVTLSTADAILIATYLQQLFSSSEEQ